MKKKILYITIIISILFVSCKNEIKMDEKNIVEKTELKIEEFDTLIKSKLTSEPNKNFEKQKYLDTLIIQRDTLLTESFNAIGIAKCQGKINGVDIYFIAKTDKDSEYLYCFGANSKRAVTYGKERNQPHTVQKLTIILLNQSKVVSDLNYDLIFSKGYVTYLSSPKNLNLTNVDEMIELGYGSGFCGGVNGSVSFFRKNNNLIKGVLTNSFGEVGTDYFVQEIIAPKNNEPNQIWVENRVGNDNVVYFTNVEKYKLKNDSIIRLNPKKDNFYYVTAKSGLRQRTGPFVESDTLELLPYRTQVNVLNETNITLDLYDEGKLISGRWVQIKYENEYEYVLSSYVFDGFLSKKEPSE